MKNFSDTKVLSLSDLGINSNQTQIFLGGDIFKYFQDGLINEFCSFYYDGNIVDNNLSILLNRYDDKSERLRIDKGSKDSNSLYRSIFSKIQNLELAKQKYNECREEILPVYFLTYVGVLNDTGKYEMSFYLKSVSNKQAKNINLSEQKNESETIDKLFFNWFKKQTYNGELYSDTTINNYIRALSKLPDDIKPDSINANLSYYTQVESFRTIKEKIENIDNFKIFDKEKWKNTYSASMNMYLRFLESELNGGNNILCFGVPGCGKSHYIQKLLKDKCVDDHCIERVTFHPDYSYGDFVGQILPSKNESKLEYRYVPGAFTSILEKAIKDPSKSYYLVIEEINRGNASAIFGDIFQLLDRENDGVSTYPITNSDIANIVHDNRNEKIKLPKNLFIYATMNTSDQNVFTLDTAFKRRWELHYIENDVEACPWKDELIYGTNVKWGDFVKQINLNICLKARDGILDEDKQIGAFFVKKETLNDKNAFANKVLMYLWNDVARFEKSSVFHADIKSFDDLRKSFSEKGFIQLFSNLEFAHNTQQ